MQTAPIKWSRLHIKGMADKYIPIFYLPAFSEIPK